MMDFLDSRLVAAINSGRCFALVGSGPSSEMGYPSWRSLAEHTFRHLDDLGLASDPASYSKYLEQSRFPELFSLAERDCGGRPTLVEIVEKLLVVTEKRPGRIYDFLTKWPFACYLTTNYDDELASRLAIQGNYYRVVQNDADAFYPFRDGVSSIIMKLHGDLEHPDNLVLTSEDYQKLETGNEGEHFRQRLSAVMHTFDVCIIGHSMTDRDLSLITQTAKNTASPAHPIYMIAADFTDAEKQEFFNRHNIVVNTYTNSSGDHQELRQMLSFAGHFIGTRRQTHIRMPTPREISEVGAATALLIYRKVNPVSETGFSSTTQALGPLILYTLNNTSDHFVSFEVLLNSEPLVGTMKTGAMRQALEKSLNELVTRSLVKQKDDEYTLSGTGKAQVKEVIALRDSDEHLAFGQFLLDLKEILTRDGLELTEEFKAQSVELLKRTLVKVFRIRGLAIARAIFAGKSIDTHELVDIFRALTTAANSLPINLRMPFSEASKNLLLTPKDPQKVYLTSLSQGYFLYHLSGLDPDCAKVRKEIFRSINWLFDSSILLPLLAVGSNNHNYAQDLFVRLKNIGVTSFTTSKLLREVTGHVSWAIREVGSVSTTSSEFLERVTEKSGFKQNLFLDGFVRLSADGHVHSFDDYLKVALPNGTNADAIVKQLQSHDVDVVSMRDLEGLDESDYKEIVEHEKHITDKRQDLGTYRSEAQVTAEAEVLQIVRGLNNFKLELNGPDVTATQTFFVSQSRVLDKVASREEVITWTPESVYRYLAALPGEELDPELLQQCMLHTYYRSGISFIDKERYEKYFGGLISQAAIEFEEQKGHFLHEAQSAGFNEENLMTAFDSTPDLEKPFFVQQMHYKSADSYSRRVELARERIEVLEGEVKVLEHERRDAWRMRSHKREEQALAEERNRRDPGHLRKRRRQAKKKRRKS